MFRVVRVFVVLGSAWSIAACSLISGGGDGPGSGLGRLAVMPLRESPESRGGDRPTLESHAGRAVTAQIYGALSEQTRFRFVPDLEVESYVGRIDRSDQLAAARQLAELSGADGVLFGTVYRFQDRIGPRYAASAPASVSLALSLYSVNEDKIVWEGQFDETQEPLSSNILNAWMFWRGGAHWFTARELSRLGIEDLIGEISR